jgi:hypothetical protein
VIDVQLAADCPAGRHAETVAIVTDDPDYREIRLPVTIDRTPREQVRALPNRATLVAGGSAIVQLHPAASELVKIASAEPSVPALTCRWALGPGSAATIRIGLDRRKWDGKPLTAEIRVRLAAPANETMIIPVSVRADE